MYELCEKSTGNKVMIYGVSEDSNGYPKLMIRKDNQWIWVSAKHYIPEDEWEKSNFKKWKHIVLEGL